MIKKCTLFAAFFLWITVIVFAGEVNESDFHFTENKGQFNSYTKYLCKLHIGNISFNDNSFTFDMYSSKELDAFHEYRHNKIKNERGFGKLHKHMYNMVFVGANTKNTIVAEDQKTDYKNYFLGNDPSKWASNVLSYRKIRYINMYDGVDVNVYSANDQLKYDFIVAKGVNPNVISIDYQGVEQLKLNNGNLEVILSNEIVKELKPVAYQIVNGIKIDVPCNFIVKNKLVSFDFPNGFNNQEELIIDPTWVFSTLTGSSSDNWGFTATYDKDGAFYGGSIVFGNEDFFDAGGYDNNASFPTTLGAYQTSFGGHIDIAITKFASNGASLLYSTYIGGSDAEEPHSLVCDSSNNLIIMGAVGSTNFPTTAGAVQSSHGGGVALNNLDGIDWDNGTDVYVAKLNSAGNNLLASTYLGGSRNDGLSLDAQLFYNYADHARGEVILDANNNIYITSTTNSTNFPTTASSHDQTGGGGSDYDAVVCKLNSTLTNLVWGTYLGGIGGDAGYSVRVDEINNKTFVCGGTESSGLATSGVIKPTYGGSVDGYIAKFDNISGTLDAYTYLGTGSYDQAFILEIDKNQDIYVTGQTRGAYPVTSGVYSNNNSSQFIHKMNNSLTTTDFSTVFGSGTSKVNIAITAFLVDNCSNIYVAGWGGGTNQFHNSNTGTTNGMPITGNAIDGSTDGSDFYFIVLERDAQSLLYGTFFGHNSAEEHVDGGTSRFDKRGTIYQAVCAGCGGNNFPTSPGAYSSTNGSSNCNYGAIKIGLDFQGVFANADEPGDIFLCGSPFNVDFSAGSTPPPNTFWDFGDGNTLGIGSDNTPMHTYADTGSYTVMYVAIDSSSCNIADTAYLNVTVINNGTLDAQIDIPPYNPCDDSLTIQLAFTGSGADSIYWSMGNGDTFINDTLFNYTYTTGGDYVVIMQAFDFACIGNVEIRDTIHYNPVNTAVTAVAPPPIVLCSQPYEVNFTGNSPAPPDGSYWDFGDTTIVSDTSWVLNPSYTYADTGVYNVKYVVIDSNTCNIVDTAHFTVTVNLSDSLSADFEIPTLDPCTSNLTVQFVNTGNGDEIHWDMGNGTTFNNVDTVNYTYTVPGTYYVSFQAIDLVCNDTINIVDTVDYNPTYTSINAISPGNILLCAQPYEVNFTGNTPQPPNSYWDFGDGIGTDTAANPLYTYANTGTYTVQYVVIDSSTCNIADTVDFTVTIEQKQFNVSFNIPPYDPCSSDSLIVQFDIPGAIADSLFWDMGDGTTYVDSVTFEHTYTPGTYIINLEAYDFLCPSSNATFSDTVFYNPMYTAVNAQPIDSVFSCGSLVVDFTGNTPSPPQNYWDFGDGQNSTLPDPTHTYATDGFYTVTYVAIDTTTCNKYDSLTFTVELVQAPSVNPTINFEPPKPCEMDSFAVDLQFTGSGVDSLEWIMGDGTIFTTNSVHYIYSSAGTYNIVLKVYNELCPHDPISLGEIQFLDISETTGIIPNVFTPNGDDWNDELVFVGIDNTQDYSIRIFDRWGRSAYESTDPDKNWDGKNAAEGTYFYELRYTDICSSEEKVVTGTVTLLRGPKK